MNHIIQQIIRYRQMLRLHDALIGTTYSRHSIISTSQVFTLFTSYEVIVFQLQIGGQSVDTVLLMVL